MNSQITRSLCCTLAVMLSACGGGGGGGSGNGPPAPPSGGSQPAPVPAPAPAPAPSPSPAPTPTFTGKVLLYVVPVATSTSTRLPEYDVTLDSDTQYLYRITAGSNQAVLIDQNFSPSYARSNIFPYSVDDRFFIRREWRPFESGGQHDLTEYNISTGSQSSSILVDAPYYFADGCSALVGDNYFYKSHPTWDALDGNQGGQFFRYSLSTATIQTLFPAGDSQNCFGHLMANDGKLYDVAFDASKRDVFTLYLRDTRTGGPVVLIGGHEDAPASFDNYQFAIEKSVFYVARLAKSTSTVEIYRYNLMLPRTDFELVYEQKIDGFVPSFLDVDDGHLMIASHAGTIVLFDLVTGKEERLNLGAEIAQIVQVYIYDK